MRSYWGSGASTLASITSKFLAALEGDERARASGEVTSVAAATPSS
jgi:hypothetical protein